MLQERNRIPIHYIKRDTFWVGRVNSLLPQADTTVPPVIVEVDPGVGGVVQGMLFWRMYGEGDTSQGPHISR